jgi:hypothetical protein
LEGLKQKIKIIKNVPLVINVWKAVSFNLTMHLRPRKLPSKRAYRSYPT